MSHEQFDAVVIGSGFGGAVTACRLTQAGLRVLILERGRRYPRGSFPRGVDQTHQWIFSERERGLLEMKPLLTEMLALQVAGYGGGSLLYNNVQLRPPEKLFHSGWPAGLSRRELDPYFDLVGYMLDITPLREEQPLGLPPRTRQFRRAAHALEREGQFFLPNLAVNFAQPGALHKNKFGVEQAGCTHCGECIVGCNLHAKNTLDLNYLAVAEQGGAQVRTSCQAHLIEPDAGGYRVTYRDLAEHGQLRVIKAPRVFLCAGAVNSTELLLRCRDQHGTLRNLSPRLGHGYSANGDFLAFIYHTKKPMSPQRGPGITSALVYDRDRSGAAKENTWFLLEDGGAPQELVSRGQALDPRQSLLKTGRALWDDVLRGLGASIAEPPPDASTEHSVALLLMGHDHANGQLLLDGVGGAPLHLRLRWDLQPNLPLYSAQSRIAKDIANALGGELVYNPTWQKLHQPITIHNLGGCAMADSPEAGVVDPHGEVFGHPGLFVLDGSIIPRAIGANPSHTIAAVAERSIESIIRRITGHPGWQAPERRLATRIEEPFDKIHIPVGGTAEPEHLMSGLTFQETMSGFLKPAWTPADDYSGAAKAGAETHEKLEFTLTITAPDADGFLSDLDHTAIATGTVHAAGFTGPEGAPVSAGVFNLFVETGDAAARRMLYALPFYGLDGQPYLLDGFKDIRDHGSFDVWAANTTLYTVIREGHSRKGAVRATGVMRIDPVHALRMAATIRVTGDARAVERARVLEQFGQSYFGTLWKVYIQPRLPKIH